MKFSKEVMKGAADVIVLQALHDLGEAYGYQLVTAIAETSDTIFEFQEGTLYPLLYRLEDKGLIKSKKKTTASGKERRYYKLSATGKTVLKARTAEYKSFVKGMTGVLNLS